jgi:acyl-CoA reductase-like NAD-dependent aldehyde dehydrogenase
MGAPASDRRFQVVNATTEEPIGIAPEGAEGDIDRAVAAARKAFDGGWGRLEVLTGGDRPADRDKGWFVSPTIFADVPNSATIARARRSHRQRFRLWPGRHGLVERYRTRG